MNGKSPTQECVTLIDFHVERARERSTIALVPVLSCSNCVLAFSRALMFTSSKSDHNRMRFVFATSWKPFWVIGFANQNTKSRFSGLTIPKYFVWIRCCFQRARARECVFDCLLYHFLAAATVSKSARIFRIGNKTSSNKFSVYFVLFLLFLLSFRSFCNIFQYGDCDIMTYAHVPRQSANHDRLSTAFIIITSLKSTKWN